MARSHDAGQVRPARLFGLKSRGYDMVRLIPAVLALGVLAAPALAEPSCKAGAPELPMWQITKSFEEAGGTIQKVQRTNGCYEIYGKLADKRVEAFFDPTSGKQIAEE
jgi:hypothetical protein